MKDKYRLMYMGLMFGFFIGFLTALVIVGTQSSVLPPKCQRLLVGHTYISVCEDK